MTTTNQYVERVPAGPGLTEVRAFATFSAQTDFSDWVMFSGDVTLQANGPVDAATVAIVRSTLDPSGGVDNAAEVEDATSAGLGLALTVSGSGNAWYRAQNKATFGPANTVTQRTLASLAAAINGLQPAANGFAAGTTPQPLVHAESDATTLTVTAVTPGAAGNAIASAGTITNGTWGDTVLENGADAVASDGTLTFTDTGVDGDEVVIGALTYTLVDALTGGSYEVLIGATAEDTRDNLLDAINAEGLQATGVLTASANPAAGSTVYIAPYTYTVVAALTSADAPFEVLRGAAATNTLDNLIAAIGAGAGGGTTYGYNTPPHPTVTAAAGAGDTIDVTSVDIGADANLIKTVEDSAGLSWGASTLTGATGPGVTYAADVDAHPLVTGTANSTDAIDVEANTAGAAGNDIATTTTSSEASWGATELENGADAVAASGVLTMSGAFVNNNTVVVGAITYTIKAALTPAAGEVQLATTSLNVSLSGTEAANVY